MKITFGSVPPTNEEALKRVERLFHRFKFSRKIRFIKLKAKFIPVKYAIGEEDRERNASDHLDWTIFIFIEIFWIFLCFRFAFAVRLVFIKVHEIHRLWIWLNVHSPLPNDISRRWEDLLLHTLRKIECKKDLTSLASNHLAFSIADQYHSSKYFKWNGEVILLACEHLIKLHRNIKQLQAFSTDCRRSKPKLK